MAGSLGSLQPLAIASHFIQRQKSLTHGKRITKVWTGRIVLTMRKAAAGQAAMCDHPMGGALRLMQCRYIAGDGVEGAERVDHPPVLARIKVFVDAGNSNGPSLGVVQREKVCAVLAFDDVGILADIERSLGTGEKGAHVAMHILRGSQILRIAPYAVRLRIGAHHLCLDEEQFFKMRLVPITACG